MKVNYARPCHGIGRSFFFFAYAVFAWMLIFLNLTVQGMVFRFYLFIYILLNDAVRASIYMYIYVCMYVAL